MLETEPAQRIDENTDQSVVGRVASAIRRIRHITSAFVWLGASETMAYPLQVILNSVIGPSAVPIMYAFIAQLVDDEPKVGNDYYSFVMIGFVTMNFLNQGLRAFSSSLNTAIQQGRFETFLVQPVSWYTLPFALAAWPMIMGSLNAVTMAVVAGALGFRIEWSGAPLAMLILLLGIASAHAIGTLAASVRLLSKKADPVVGLYTMASGILSGTFFPVSMLPGFIQPLSYGLPLTYVINVIRQLLMIDGQELTGPSITTSILALLLMTAVTYAVAMVSFGRALDFGRRYGVIGDY